MPFVVKATYRNETRKFSFNNGHFPSYEELYHQLYRVFAIGSSYYLSKLLFSPHESTRILIGMEAHSAAEYDIHCAPFKGHIYPDGRLMFSVFDETPHKVPAFRTAPGSSIHPIPPVPPTPSFAPPPPPPSPPRISALAVLGPTRDQLHPRTIVIPTRSQAMDDNSEPAVKKEPESVLHTECCSVSQGKKEVKSMMDDFLRDFTRIMGSTFGEPHSFLDPLDTPTVRHASIARGSSPLPAIDLDASLHIPGSFIQPRADTPDSSVDDADVEKSLTPPQLEPCQTLHPGIWCDFCGKQIRGLRFKCQECAFYDLCANCIVVNQALDKHNANQTMIHRFTTINPPCRTEPTSRGPVTGPSPRGQHAPSSGICNSRPIHSGIICDLCQQIVVGNRHKCLNCVDYDLCDNCIKIAPTEHPDHRFITLETPTRARFQTPPVPSERYPASEIHNARCNLCDSRIIGARYKCKDCPDFDTCASCFTITSEQHPFHAFVKMTRPTDLKVRGKPAAVNHSATCDVCDKSIVGVRYKCMHADCPDFDLCQDCEALPILVHPATHPFLKVKSREIHIPWVQRNTPPVLPRPVPESSLSVAPAVPIPISTMVSASDSTPHPPNQSRPRIPSPPIHRLHAIRAQAERRLSARMQQLRSYPFVDGSVNPPVDPSIEDRLMRERKEAEEKAQMIDQEIEELEKARVRKHDDALKLPSPPYLESVKATFADTPDVYQNILKLLLDRFSATNTAIAASITQQIRQLLEGHPTLLEGLDAFVAKDVVSPPPSHAAAHQPQAPAKGPAPPEEVTPPLVPEMVQRKIGFFGNPFIHPLESSFQAGFISDNNIPDGHPFPAGTEFVKSWRLENDGTEPWSMGTELVFVGGMRLGAFAGAPTTYRVGMVPVGEQVDVCAGDMKAPDVPGRYISHWRLRDSEGKHFGPRMWCDIEVLEVESDNSQHGSLVSSAVVMPVAAPEQPASVGDPINLPSGSSSPITAPSSAITIAGDASSDASSVGSASIDSDWDEIQDVPPQKWSSTPDAPGEDVEYQVLYDSASDEA